MAKLTAALRLTLHNEGGYANVEGDRGGETYCGIARNFHPNWEGWAQIDSFKQGCGGKREIKRGEMGLVDDELVVGFYKTKFWDKIGGERLIDQKAASQVFDHAVNAGVSAAVKILQAEVKAVPDGKLGPETIRLANEAFKASGEAANRGIFKRRARFYLSIINDNPENEKFLAGWLSRTLKCYKGG